MATSTPVDSRLEGLTLDQGITAGETTNIVTNNTWGEYNPGSSSVYGGFPAHPLANGVGPPGGFVPKRVGLIQNAYGSLPGNNVYGCYFQYNPNEVDVTWNIDPSQQIPYVYAAGLSAQNVGLFGTPGSTSGNSILTKGSGKGQMVSVPNMLSAQSISWSLIFDRTYDMMYEPNPDSSRGVLKDVAALYNVMGTFETVGVTPASLNVQVMFGVTSAGSVWGFTGNITSITLAFGIFRGTMIPSRCEVSLTMSVHYTAPSVPPAATPSTPTPTGPLAAAGQAAIGQALGLLSQPAPPKSWLPASNKGP